MKNLMEIVLNVTINAFHAPMVILVTLKHVLTIDHMKKIVHVFLAIMKMD